jgi:hypothetical protein
MTQWKSIDEFRDHLTHELIQLDRQESAQETKRRLVVNIYRLGHYLKAAQGVVGAVRSGESPAKAFAAGFVATRSMHTIAKRLGLGLDVERGEWRPVDGPKDQK